MAAETGGEKCYTAQLLSSMFNDISNYLYLLIVEPILLGINAVNLIFQREDVDVSCAYANLGQLVLLLPNKVMVPSCISNDIIKTLKNVKFQNNLFKSDKVDYGIAYNVALLEHSISTSARNAVETRAYNYIMALIRELEKRLPDHIQHFKKLKYICPEICLNQIKRIPFKDLPFLNIFGDKNKFIQMENQYQKLISINWSEILLKEDLENTFKFWARVSEYKNTVGKRVFNDLGEFMLKLLTLPSSNAVVERAFSIMNCIKNKWRNRMLLDLLESIMRIRMRFYSRKSCCNTYIPCKAMIRDFNSRVMYPAQYEQ